MAKVMIIDDDRTTVTLLETLLQMDGFEVVSEARKDKILPGIRSAAPDLVLMDVFLAHSDGMGVLADLGSEPGLAALRVVLTPDSPDQLAKVIQENIGADGGRAVDPALHQE